MKLLENGTDMMDSESSSNDVGRVHENSNIQTNDKKCSIKITDGDKKNDKHGATIIAQCLASKGKVLGCKTFYQ